MQFAGGKLEPNSVSSDSIEIEIASAPSFKPTAVVVFETESDRIHLWSDQLLADSSYKIEVKGIRTVDGKHLKDEKAECSARIRGKDEAKPTIVGRNPEMGRTIIVPQESLKIMFSEPVTIDDGAAKVVIDSTRSVMLRPRLVRGLSYAFVPVDSLPAVTRCSCRDRPRSGHLPPGSGQPRH